MIPYQYALRRRMMAQSKGVTFGELSVGTIVFVDYNNVPTEFIVVQQGRPSSSYDSSCNGTWLLSKNSLSLHEWDEQMFENEISESDIHSYINTSLFGSFGTNVQTLIKTVKIPYVLNSIVKSGSSGLSCKLFLLSIKEVNGAYDSADIIRYDGTVLSYFKNAGNSSRIATYDGETNEWWLRTPAYKNEVEMVSYVDTAGKIKITLSDSSFGVRPAFIVPSNEYVDNGFSL